MYYDSIKQSDRHLGDNIWGSLQLIYGKRIGGRYGRHNPSDKGTILKVGKIRYNFLLKKAAVARFITLKLAKELDFDLKTLRIRFCSMKGQKSGMYCQSDNTVSMYPCSSIKFFTELLAHELVHAEQFKQGRLSYEGRDFSWKTDNEKYRARTSAVYNYDSYTKMPWEVEAYDRQGPLAESILDVVTQFEEALCIK